MHYFVKNPDTNHHINTIHLYVQEGRLDADIAGLMNKKGIKNLQATGPWTESQVEQVRWDYKLDSEKPTTIGEAAFKKAQKKKKRGFFWTVLALIITPIYLIMVYSFAFSEALSGSKLAVYLLIAIIFPFLVVGLFQIFSGFRNKRSRMILFFWVVLIMIIMNTHKLFTPVLPLIEGKQLPDITETLDPVTSNVDKLKVISEAKIKEGFVKAKHLYDEKVMGKPPVEEAPETADQTDSQPAAVEETTEEADETESQTPVKETSEEADKTESQPYAEEVQEEANTTESQTPVEEVSEEADTAETAVEEALEEADKTETAVEEADEGDAKKSDESNQ